MQAQITRVVDEYDSGRLTRRQLVAHLTFLAAAAATAPALAQSAISGGAPPPPPPSTFQALDLNHIALRVTDIGRSVEFYRRHLGLAEASRSDSSAFLRCGARGFVALFRSEQAAMDHYCYSIEEYDPARAVATLEAAGLAARRRGDRVYFDDPDGLEVQVASPSHSV
jgi:catechol 2,3-dioxygenase-like lactoylglutathione lyase family enzyme